MNIVFKVTLECESCGREKTYIYDKDEFRKKKPINKQLALFLHSCELCDAPMRMNNADGYLTKNDEKLEKEEKE